MEIKLLKHEVPAEPPETAAPTLEPKTKHITQAVLLPTGAPGTTHQIKQVIISLKGARGIPTPNDRRLSDIMYRSLRAVLFYDPPNDPTGKFKRRSDRFLLNSYCTPAHQDPHKEECWLITDIDGDHKFLIRTDFMDESNRDYLQHLYVVFEFTIGLRTAQNDIKAPAKVGRKREAFSKTKKKKRKPKSSSKTDDSDEDSDSSSSSDENKDDDSRTGSREHRDDADEPHQVFKVTVPPGVQPGQAFEAIANGQRVMVNCPNDVKPGQKIPFKVPVQQYHTMEMSCGWCKVSMAQLLHYTSESRIKATINGGTPFVKQDINQKEVQQRRYGWRYVMKKVVGVSKISELEIKVIPVSRLPVAQQDSIYKMPKNILLPVSSIQMVQMYREYAAAKIHEMNSNQSHPVAGLAYGARFSEPVLALFPKLIDDQAMVLAMRHHWDQEMKTVSKSQKSSQKELLSRFISIVLRLWPAQSLPKGRKDPVIPESYEQMTQRARYIQRATSASVPFHEPPQPMVNAPTQQQNTNAQDNNNDIEEDEEADVYIPFHTAEIAFELS